MVLLHTPEKKTDFKAPDFSLQNIDGQRKTLTECMGKNGLLVMFICNHCPYVLEIIDRLAETCKSLQNQGIGCVAIMPNDTESYPDDSFENMKHFAKRYNLGFPYLIDETQNIAHAYDAVCTPDFFGFDKNATLQYRGRLDSAASKPTTADTIPELYNALLEIKKTGTCKAKQTPSMGCSIKWRE